MSILELYVATATVDPARTHPYWKSWREKANIPFVGSVVVNGFRGELEEGVAGDLRRLGHQVLSSEILGVVPAFSLALLGLPDEAVIALFHDDLRIDEEGWDETVERFFQEHPKAVLAGLGGAYGVGRRGMYWCQDHAGSAVGDFVGECSFTFQESTPCGKGVRFDPMTLARHHFMSNMVNAEAHGERVHTARPVAVLDGFSLIGRGWFIKRLLAELGKMGVIHHAYDCYAGVLARRLGMQTWLIPVACHHAGGQTAVGSAEYQKWAQERHGGDQQIWLDAHRAVWEASRDVLPFDVREG
jgi:hypothetical protein